MRRLFDDLRGYAAPVKLDRRNCDLRDVVSEAWKSLESVRQGRDAELRIESDGDCFCRVDPLQLEQVFRNVLENALAACQDPVALEADVRPARCSSTTDGLRVVVHDNGPGLSAEQQSRAFEPFFTTKSRGTGLGMAITKRIVEAHGGKIDIKTAPEGGAVVVITLPRGDN